MFERPVIKNIFLDCEKPNPASLCIYMQSASLLIFAYAVLGCCRIYMITQKSTIGQ